MCQTTEGVQDHPLVAQVLAVLWREEEETFEEDGARP